MGLVYLLTFAIKINYINVGKYTVRPLDPSWEIGSLMTPGGHLITCDLGSTPPQNHPGCCAEIPQSCPGDSSHSSGMPLKFESLVGFSRESLYTTSGASV